MARCVALLVFALAAACDGERAPEVSVRHHVEPWTAARVIVAGGDLKGRGDGPVVIYLHGFASLPAHQLPLAASDAFPAGTRFVFPEGPLGLSTGDGPRRAWWMVDHGLRARLRREPYGLRELAGQRPAGMARARRVIVRLLEEAPHRLDVSPDRIVLAGFSQGAMLAIDSVLHTDRRIAGVASLSGSLVSAQEWVPRMHARRGLPAFVSHGREDAVLPFALSEQLAAHLTEHGLDVRWHPHEGGHAMHPSAARAFAQFVRDVTARREVTASR